MLDTVRELNCWTCGRGAAETRVYRCLDCGHNYCKECGMDDYEFPECPDCYSKNHTTFKE